MVHVIFSGSTLPLITFEIFCKRSTPDRWIHRFFAKRNWLPVFQNHHRAKHWKKNNTLKLSRFWNNANKHPSNLRLNGTYYLYGQEKNKNHLPVTKSGNFWSNLGKLVSKISFRKWCATTCRQPQPTNHSWPTCLGELQRAVWVVNVCVYCQETWVEANFTSP